MSATASLLETRTITVPTGTTLFLRVHVGWDEFERLREFLDVREANTFAADGSVTPGLGSARDDTVAFETFRTTIGGLDAAVFGREWDDPNESHTDVRAEGPA
jgi:hypothetical protein